MATTRYVYFEFSFTHWMSTKLSRQPALVNKAYTFETVVYEPAVSVATVVDFDVKPIVAVADTAYTVSREIDTVDKLAVAVTLIDTTLQTQLADEQLAATALVLLRTKTTMDSDIAPASTPKGKHLHLCTDRDRSRTGVLTSRFLPVSPSPSPLLVSVFVSCPTSGVPTLIISYSIRHYTCRIVNYFPYAGPQHC